VVPEAVILEETARIYDLQEPTAKMSKSASSESGVVWMMDEPSVTAKKIRSAVTDDGREVRFDRAQKPGVANLLTIYSVLADKTIAELEEQYAGRGYGDLKKDLADVVVETFGPIRARTLELLDDPAELDRVLAGNADRAAEIADATLAKVYDRIGLLPRG
jgi:tryptophanyl-tRNA synthetase